MALFTQKFDEPKRLRSIRLTDTAWDALEQLAISRGLTRTDLLEEWARQQIDHCRPESVTKDQLQQHINSIAERTPPGRKAVLQRSFALRLFLDLQNRAFPNS